MNIKKQIRTLYIYEMISGLQIVDLVWVLFLIQRGFSLAEAGIAEGVFHVVSMCCERFIPLLTTTGFVPFPAGSTVLPRFLYNYPRFYLGYLHKNRGSSVRSLFLLVLPGQLSTGESLYLASD